MTTLIKRVIQIIMFVGFICTTYGQNECTNTLKKAQTLYDQGTTENIPHLLEDCLASGFSREERVQALRLLTLVYLFDDDYPKADEYMVRLLKVEPELEVNPAVDPVEFINLFESYRTLPFISFGMMFGGNISRVHATSSYGVHNVNRDGTTNFYKTRGGILGGLKFHLFLFRNCELNTDFLFQTRNLQYEASVFDYTNPNTGQQSTWATIDFAETQSWLEVPITITYDFLTKHKVYPFVRVGASAGYLLSAQGSAERRYDESILLGTVTGAQESIIDQRNRLNFWGIAGLGLKYRIKRGHIFLDARYSYGLLNQTEASSRYTNSTFTYKFYYVSDDFLIDNLSASLGLVRYIYKPKKKKE